jgi:tetratricopeptide (TPR) repeat protein
MKQAFLAAGSSFSQVTPRRVVRLLILLAVAGVLTWWWYRQRPPQPPPLPAIDLSKAEEPVVAAIEAAQNRVRREPFSPRAWGFLGEVLFAHGYIKEANECFLRAADMEPAEPRWPYFHGIALGVRGQDGLPWLERAAALCDEHDPNVTGPRLAVAETLLERQRYDEADELFRRVAATHPDDVRLLYDRGVLAMRRNDLSAAEGYFTRVADSPYARQRACANLAMIYLSKNQPERAAEYSEKARRVREDPGWDDPYVKEYASLDVSHHARLAKATQLDEAHRPEEARSVVEELLQDSRTELNQLAFATALSKQGQYEESIDAFQKLLKENPNKVQAHYTLGLTQFHLGLRLERAGKGAEAQARFREAVASSRRAIELKQDHAFAHLFLGRALEKLGQPKEALAAYRRCVELKPESASTHVHLGAALSDRGQDAEALKELELAVRLAAPDDARPRIALERLREKMARRPK